MLEDVCFVTVLHVEGLFEILSWPSFDFYFPQCTRPVYSPTAMMAYAIVTMRCHMP